MNIQHLKYIIEVERTGSITQAAENLFMNQPNLSKVIREIEDEMGFTIFKRSSRGIELTARGATFLDYAKRIVSLVTELESLNKPFDETQQRFSLAAPPDGCIAEAFIRFAAALDHNSAMELDMVESDLMDTIDNVLRGRTCLGIIRYKEVNEEQILRHIAEKELKSSLINEFSCCLVMSAAHPLAKKERIVDEDMEDYAEISQTDMSLPRIRKAGARKKAVDKRIRIYDRGSQLSLLERDNQAYMWAHPLPRALLEKYDLVQRCCDTPENHYKDLLIMEKRYCVNYLEQDFLDQLSAVYAEAKKILSE